MILPRALYYILSNILRTQRYVSKMTQMSKPMAMLEIIYFHQFRPAKARIAKNATPQPAQRARKGMKPKWATKMAQATPYTASTISSLIQMGIFTLHLKVKARTAKVWSLPSSSVDNFTVSLISGQGDFS